ncbi:MAG: hypothetical protein KJ915_10075 [Candidatus Omnitrophica bacterium]|nr:hypothetical protein [Candidatus Omnitrophota bacterium]
MTAKDIIKKLDKLDIYQQRRVADNYAEIVILNSEIFICAEIMDELMGAPVSAAGIKPTEQDIADTKDFGGIFDEQTLYKKDFDRARILVMFWPWQDGEHITLKVVCLSKEEDLSH